MLKKTFLLLPAIYCMRQLQLDTCDFGMGHKNQCGCVPKVLKGIAMNVSYVFQDHFYLANWQGSQDLTKFLISSSILGHQT